MSFGRPPSGNAGFQVSPPDRGSFPLDHEGECKNQMMLYLGCLKRNGHDSTPCRLLSKDYLDCRMTKGLMAADEWKNLGMANLEGGGTRLAQQDSVSPVGSAAKT
ncbi:hypothetical protein PUNSTDRAFT_56533 [Punctularia strigosozonata HHB-11173 SS5]|uniref:uncharacterized protein n=1 Tax=Punctularia strigosozonata (strain HHB-11173) TaxID=741275 RepID=UPI00044183BE|nr:uncharacterized protein PUNSTDRAFT_56533 [Punctularia strigosozonata HHB-11173 SS5]EIN13661.1 hypothetical protein PUNSTDRAFT_56533 [Punctularia strigosozonata HHB-11173 SS5]